MGGHGRKGEEQCRAGPGGRTWTLHLAIVEGFADAACVGERGEQSKTLLQIKNLEGTQPRAWHAGSAWSQVLLPHRGTSVRGLSHPAVRCHRVWGWMKPLE